MEMVGEGQNQSKSATKWTNKSQNTVKKKKKKKKGEEDRISALPDCLLVEILSRLPSTKCAIRTGTLSKRWKHLWTLVHTLIFIVLEFDDSSDFVSFVDKTLTQCRQLKLKQFKLYTNSDIRFESQFNRWIRYAISCSVEEFIFKWCTTWRSESFQLDQVLYISSCFTDLTLMKCVLNPIGAVSWKNLRSLSLSSVDLDEDLIENILSGSPVLETLALNYCSGYQRLDITSKTVKNLFLKYEGFCEDIFQINAPDILSLTIKGSLLLWKLLLLNVSSLVEANLDYQKFGHYETTFQESEEETLKGFIVDLRHVKELKIGVSCSQVLSRLEAKCFIIPSNIKFPDVTLPVNDSESVQS